MATLEKKYNPAAYDFDINDCHKAVEIYLGDQKRQIPEKLSLEEMLHQFRLAFASFKIAHHQNDAPTITQLRKQHTDIRKKAINLLIDLEEKTDTHFPEQPCQFSFKHKHTNQHRRGKVRTSDARYIQKT